MCVSNTVLALWLLSARRSWSLSLVGHGDLASPDRLVIQTETAQWFRLVRWEGHSKASEMNTACQGNGFIKYSTAWDTKKQSMRSHPEVPKEPKPNLLLSLAGVGIAGFVYGSVLWVVLWFVRSSDIADWNATYWKCSVTTLAVNALRLYDRRVFNN